MALSTKPRSPAAQIGRWRLLLEHMSDREPFDAQHPQPCLSEIRRRDLLGGLVHEYYVAAA
jgi:hypothetical protein